jgi:enterobactin synthetase component D
MIELTLTEDGLPFAAADIAVARCRFAFDAAGLAGATAYRHAGDLALEVDLPPSLSRAVAKRQVEFLAGRLCAAQAMRRLRGHHQPVPIRPDRSPAWPEGLVGSISHTDGLALAGVAEAQRYRSLGLDLERELAAEVASQVGPLLLDDGEWRRRPPGWTETVFTTLVFSAKEALYKAIHPIVQRMMEFHDARLLAVEKGHVVLELAPAMRSDRLPGSRFPVQFGFEGPVCLTMLALPA